MRKASLLLFVLVCALMAGYFEPPFEDYLQTVPGNAEVRAIVIMADQVNVGALDAELTARNADRQERHYVVCTALMNKCDQTQKDILAFLNQQKAAGNIRRIRSFWLSNSIALECKKSVLDQVVARQDVDIIYRDLPVELIKPVYVGPAPDHSKAYEWSLAMVRADSCWRRGIDGLSRLTFSLDTGVYLQHVALVSRWRGRNGATLTQAWKDALGSQPNPQDTYGHGTHCTGTMVGGTPGDTVGMAPGGQWIADNAINQGVGAAFDADVRDAYLWGADPDANPATVYDMPDACQNSWGIDARFSGYVDCDRRWNAEIYALEAAGCIVEFSAGNEGPTRASHRSPANICSTFTLNYAVGAVDNTELIASFSSRGPTDCTMYSATTRCKPEVSAPGVNVRSTLNSGGYGLMSGTSMAGPHVAGAFLLARQYNTNIQADTLKKLMMYTSRDKGTAGEDSIYGWGIIDMARLLNVMPRSPSLAYYRHAIIDNWGNGNNNGRADPGERVRMIDTIWSAGGRRATGITGVLRLRSGFTYAVIEDSLGTFTDLDSVGGANRKGNNSADQFQFRVLSTIPAVESIIPFVLELRSNGGTYRVSNLYAHWRGYNPVKIVEERSLGIPAEFSLKVTSPARSNVRVTYALPQPCHVSLKLYNVTGSLTKNLVDSRQEAGTKTLILDGLKLPAGIYFVDFTYDNNNMVKKLVLTK